MQLTAEKLAESCFGPNTGISYPLFRTMKGELRGIKVEFLNAEEIQLLQVRDFIQRIIETIRPGPVRIRKDIKELLGMVGVIALEGHRLPDHEDRRIQEVINIIEEPSFTQWHEDGFSRVNLNINILHRNASDPKRDRSTCFTSASYVHSQLQPQWAALRQRAEQVGAHVFSDEVRAYLDALGQERDETLSVRYMLKVLSLMGFVDRSMEMDGLGKIDIEDESRVYKCDWKRENPQTVIFWNGMLPPGVKMANDILHGAEGAPNLAVNLDEHLRRIVLS